MTSTRVATAATPTRILDAAERLVQTRGFNGFSYADIAAELGITTASLHYHFAGKAELGRTLIVRYTDRFSAALHDIAASTAATAEKLEAYAGLYATVLQDDRSCLCGMLAAEFLTLPEPMREAVIAFFDLNERWLTAVLIEGRGAGELRFTGEPAEVARLIVSSLEGAMLVARPYGDIARFQSAAARILAGLAGLS